jgi:hypothetical protein
MLDKGGVEEEVEVGGVAGEETVVEEGKTVMQK